MIHAGRLSDRVRIQQRTVIHTAAGEEEEWVTLEHRWARVIPFMVVPIRYKSDYAAYGTEMTGAYHVVVFRGTVDVTLSDHRILWHNHVLVPARSEVERGGPTVGFTSVYCRHDPSQACPPEEEES